MERPEIINPYMKAMMQPMITWGELADRMISLGLNLLTGVMVGLSLSKLLIMSLKIGELICAGRCNLMKGAHSFWCSVKNRESRGVEGMMKKQIMPTRTVNNPSYTEVIEDGIVRIVMRSKTYENENPSPSWSSTNAIHVLDCCRKQPGKRAGELREH